MKTRTYVLVFGLAFAVAATAIALPACAMAFGIDPLSIPIIDPHSIPIIDPHSIPIIDPHSIPIIDPHTMMGWE